MLLLSVILAIYEFDNFAHFVVYYAIAL